MSVDLRTPIRRDEWELARHESAHCLVWLRWPYAGGEEPRPLERVTIINDGEREAGTFVGPILYTDDIEALEAGSATEATRSRATASLAMLLAGPLVDFRAGHFGWRYCGGDDFEQAADLTRLLAGGALDASGVADVLWRAQWDQPREDPADALICRTLATVERMLAEHASDIRRLTERLRIRMWLDRAEVVEVLGDG